MASLCSKLSSNLPTYFTPFYLPVFTMLRFIPNFAYSHFDLRGVFTSVLPFMGQANSPGFSALVGEGRSDPP